MPIASMTGFARVEGGYDGIAWTLEMRSVNGRGLDIKYRFPPGYDVVERAGRDLAKTRFQRGQMAVTLTVTTQSGLTSVAINHDVLAAFVSVSQSLVEAGHALTPSADGLLALRGVIDAGSDDRIELASEAAAALTADVETLFDAMKAARLSEGMTLHSVVTGHVAVVSTLVARADTLAGQQIDLIRERFARRMAELLPAGEDFQERMLQESAVLGGKADVREELDRLKAHIEQAMQLLDATEAPGRKLDFLCQEFMREANTLCSKSAFIDLTQTGLELKAVIDQFREQIQNVE